MDPDRRQRLEQLPGWFWDPFSTRWEDGFSHLSDFSQREGHCRVAAEHKTKDDFRLGDWVGKQRAYRNKMDADRQQRLEALPGWVWRVRIVNRIGWDEMYGRLIVYQRANGALPSTEGVQNRGR